MNTIEQLNSAANNIRVLAASMVEKAKSGHPGGAMGGADFVNVLYSEFLEYDPKNPKWEGRDRFFLDPGHMSPMLYSVLACTGKYSLDELKQFRQWGSPTPGHPEVDFARGVENTSGPLGQGHTFAVGAAIAAKFLKAKFGDVMNQTIYAFISDGGIQEEISQGAGRTAGFLGLDNLIMFYDSNDVQLSTMVDEVTNEDVAAKYRAWNWNVITINGNDAAEIRSALTAAKAESKRPTLIIGKTIMGKGAVKEDGSNFEGQCSTHGQPLGDSGASFAKTIENLGGDVENQFQFFAATKEIYAKREQELNELMAVKKAAKEEWAKANPEKAAKLAEFFSGNAPKLDWSKVEQKANQATRAASATALGFLAKNVENMIVSSADLSNSDKSDGFLKQTKSMTNDNFEGAFLQAGVSELTMACLCIGMALHGGVVAACSTFFVFSDYMKPAIRLAALMELPVKFFWTHDAFRVGEDGPTHQPIEQEAQLRLLEKIKNHSGKSSMLVLRPADVYETTLAWKLAMENVDSPTGLIFSRQNIKDLNVNCISKGVSTVECGGYIVEKDENPDIVLLASGSEVSTLSEAAAIVREKGVKVQLVSIPSEGLFRIQSKEYQDSVLPQGIKRFGLTAGLPIALEGLVGENGYIHGLSSFGYSAPFTVLDDKFGFTPAKVAEMILNNL